ncbi:PAS domain S-box protein [Myxococcus sp. CA040A]|uniref:PAS domain-containing sensor histidine kinase n=1 Tax=Myxococcus sp. CA040A TaxID=2741738 RepID=UPI00157A23A2|nr:PAS domain S-box protein [Myxococcus sp. CA040A]NTX06565.1 PAS domain S-box protein [Myxococcus sp. CA040A]
MAGANAELSAWLDAAVDPLVACDANEQVCFLNRAAERLFAWKREDLQGQPVSRLFPERMRRHEGQSLVRYLLSRRDALEGRPTRVFASRRDGVEILVELTVGTSGQGDDERIVLSLRRLHEVIDTLREPLEHPRHAGAARLVETRARGEDLYRLVVENAPLGIFHYDTSPVITACNERFVTILGATKRIIVGLNLLSLRDEGMMRCVRETLAGRSADYEGDYVSVTGHKVTPVHVRFAPCYNDAGAVEGGVGIVEDVSQRRFAERERDESLALLTMLFDSAPVGLGFVDARLRYVRVNERLARINGRPAEEHLGKDPHQVLGPGGPAVEEMLRRVLETGEPVVEEEVDTKVMGVPGPRRLLAGSCYPVRAPDGRTLGVGVLVEDITQRKLAEEERERLYHEAQQAIRVRDDFLSIASHELKTPLTPLSLRLATLERRLERGESVDPTLLRHARQHLLRMTGLINDLLDASRIEAGRLALHPQATRMDSLVEHVLQAMDAQRGGHELRYQRPENAVQVFADPYRLEQVISNLVENAFKYSPDGGVIQVTLETHGELALLSVKDPGIGIPEDQQRMLFERYFRARNVSSRSYGGLGLGLYISRDIVERHGGRIWVESQVGQGSTFHVALPLLSGTSAHPPATQPDRHVH